MMVAMLTSSHHRNRRSPTIATYAFAHFGKSLWWNGSELFLAFYLTEHLHLEPLIAGCTIAVGLISGAAFDLLVGARLSRFASAPGLGRLQFVGAGIATLALALLGSVVTIVCDARLPTIIGANVVYRLAYTLYDLPQNTLLSLAAWTPDQRRRAAAARSAASAIAMLLMAGLVSMDRPWSSGGIHAAFAGFASVIALLSAGRLWCESRRAPDDCDAVSRTDETALAWRWPLVLMALVCLTLPAFSKFAPYLISYSPGSGVQIPLVVTGMATVASQPIWITLLRRLGEIGAGIAAALVMIVAAFSMEWLWVASLLVGIASGGFGTVIWSGFAISVAGRHSLAAAPAFARLTATAKIALAVAAIGMGAILSTVDYRQSGVGLIPFMRGLMLVGGVLTAAYLSLVALPKREKRAG